MKYGLTESGFVPKTFQAILEEEREAWKAAFGYEISTSKETPEGAYIGNQAIKLAQLWEMMEGLWAAGDVDSASGVYLDRLADLVNVKRKAAEATRVFAALWGKEGTPVIAGHLAKTDNGELFALQKTTLIKRDKLLGFAMKIKEAEAGAYAIAIDGHIVSYAAEEGESKEGIQQGICERLEAVFPGVFAAEGKGSGSAEIRSKGGIVPFALSCDDPNIEIASLGAYGVYKATVAGPIYCGIGTLNKIVANVSGLDRVVNYATGITGREAEGDTGLRLAKANRQKQASANELAIQNAVELLPGVLYCKVYSNRKMAVVKGRPPRSYETVVVGGVDEEIAEAILEKGPAGIEPFGNTVKSIKDSQGTDWDIGFTRPVNRYLWLRLIFERDDEIDFPRNGAELMKDYVAAWGKTKLGVGRKFFYQRLLAPCQSVPGVGRVKVLAAVTENLDPPNAGEYAMQNIAVSEREIAVIDKSRIAVEEKAEANSAEPEEPEEAVQP